MFEQGRALKNDAGKSIFRAPEQESGMTRYHVSGVNDPSERSAERMADQVMGMDGGIFRSADGGPGAAGGDVSIPSGDLMGAGSAMPETLQRSMEGAFGASFDGVRVHTDAGADRASRGLSARAFTRGQDMYFRSGAYDPESQEGQHLIAHELAHVAAGQQGLHRVFEQPTFENTAPDESLDEKGRKAHYDKQKEEILAGADSIVGAKDALLADQAKMSIRYAGASYDSFSREELNASKEKMNDRESIANAAAAFVRQLDQYMEDYAVYEFEPENRGQTATNQEGSFEDRLNADGFYAMLKIQRGRVNEAKEQCESRKDDVDAVLTLINNLATEMDNQPAVNSEKVEMSEPVKKMVKSSFFDQFIKGVVTLRNVKLNYADKDSFDQKLNDASAGVSAVQESGLQKAKRINDAASSVTGIAGIGGDLTGDAADIAGEYRSEEDNADFSKRAGITSVVTGSAGAITGTIDTGLSIAQLHQKESKRNEKMKALGMNKFDQAADHLNRMDAAGKSLSTLGSLAGIGSAGAGLKDDDTTQSALDVTGNVLGTAGDALGLASSDQKRRQQKKQEEAAKRSLDTMGAQLIRTLPPSGTPLQSRQTKIMVAGMRAKSIAKGEKAKGNQSTMTAAVQEAKEPNLEPALETKQKSLLDAMLALDISINHSREAAKDLAADVAFGSIGMAGDITKLIASSLKAADLGPVGPILGAVGSLLGAIGSLRGIFGGLSDAGDSGKAANDAGNKQSVCKAAISQMTSLPYLDVSALRAAAGASGEAAKVTRGVNEAAEQYAAVYSIIEAGNVEMADILFAISKGGFDGATDTNASMQRMYENLSFSNLDM